MSFSLDPLPYPYEALEPHIDTQTMQIHHDKHHQAYVNNLNAAIAGHEADSWDIEKILTNLDKIPEDKRMAVRNNGGGHHNHALFWEILTPGGSSTPSGALLEAINATFGSFDNLKAELTKAGTTRFGSGWAWLVLKADKSLAVMSTPNQDSPLMEGLRPILGIDVWEHAYYLKYQNRRPDYLAAIFNVINWSKVGELYNKYVN
jgi:Fe-Mn family superoxide dismutase